MTIVAPILLVLVLALPLALALAAPFVARPLNLLAWAALPGLVAALTLAPGTVVDVPVVVLGLSLAVDGAGRIFLGAGALLWLIAGIYARDYMAGSPRPREFSACWLVTLAGTLGTFIAADIVTFYMSFSLMSLAAYALVVHDREPAAWRAGRIYIILAVVGETALLGGFIISAAAADSLAITQVQAALPDSPWRNWALAGFLVGFGMKAGLVPLHVWLPIAHPQAPTPASAVLSGVIVNAGIIGLLRFVPFDGGAWSLSLVVLGLVTTFYGALAGLAQSNTKALLAYSTLSQMGVLVTVIGTAEATSAVSLYAAHHGLAKGALFLGIGVVAASGQRSLRWILPVVGLMALAIAGLPLTGGALAKLAIKDLLGDNTAATLVTVSAVTTALLMLRFIYLEATAPRDGAGTPPLGLILPWAATVVAALVLPWVLFPVLTDHPAAYPLTPENLWAGLWPILVALAVAALALIVKLPAVTLPQGDLVVIAEAAARRIRLACTATAETARALRLPQISSTLPGRLVSGIEQRSEQWTVVGPALLILAVLIGLALL
ncbi:MAG TPA: complex I subunit 5 family protein [Aestuariivirgaceae bacterium]|nr:complex I subunit 5 family protein [Aestuariivirgaceae bacterium]